VDGEKTVLPPQDSNLVAAGLDDPETPILEIAYWAYVNRHVTFSAAATGFSSWSAFHP
jgi:hypothetical protein